MSSAEAMPVRARHLLLDDAVRALAWQGSTLAAGSSGGTVATIDPIAGHRCQTVTPGRPVRALAWHRHTLAAAAGDVLWLWSARAEPVRVDLGAPATALDWCEARGAVAVAAGWQVHVHRDDGTRLDGLVSADGTARDLRWATGPGDLAVVTAGGVAWYGVGGGAGPYPMGLDRSAGSPTTLSMGAAREVLAWGTLSGTICVRDLAGDAWDEVSGYPDPVEHVALCGNGTWLVAACGDEITCWRLSPGAALTGGELVVGDQPRILHGHDAETTALAGGPGDRFASGDAAGTVVLWDPDGPIDRVEPSSSSPTAVTALALSDQGHLAIGHLDGTLTVRSPATL
jgi:WD40 repeat protein